MSSNKNNKLPQYIQNAVSFRTGEMGAGVDPALAIFRPPEKFEKNFFSKSRYLYN